MRRKINKKKSKKNYIYGKSILPYIILLIVCIIGCIIRYPDFETALWSASDTNYQCLMNAEAMLSADDEAVSFLPLITFSEEADYGLEYSSGAFDKKTGKYFYYISFPAFPFTVFTLFLKITGMAVNEVSMYFFCSILFCISTLAVTRLFIIIFQDRLNQNYIAFMAGTTYLFSVEIMHSMGLTYWGQNWYMIFFPELCIWFLKISYLDKPKILNYFTFFLFGFLLLQTEWSGYFALFAFWALSLVRWIKGREKKNLYLVIGIAVETILSIFEFVMIRGCLVGFSKFINVLGFRMEGRSRISDYALLEIEKALRYSFGGMLVLIVGYGIWLLIYKLQSKTGISLKKGDLPILLLFLFPVFENHIFVNHALTYSMDRMKWYFIIFFVLLFIVSELIILKKSKIVICYSTIIVMGLSIFGYLFVENDYRWTDERLKASRVLKQYIEENYSNNVLGQLGSNSVWGYSKMLFGHGIVKQTSVHNLATRTEQFGMRYAVALNELDLAYTQKWYSSAVIYDLLEDEYIIAGSLENAYSYKIDDLVYLKEAEFVDLYIDNFHNFIHKISFSEGSSVEEKESQIYNFIRNYNVQQGIFYYAAKAKEVPCVIMVEDISIGEWLHGVSTTQNRLIFLNTEGNQEILEHIGAISSKGVGAEVIDVFMDEVYIYVDIKTDYREAFSYPNTIIVAN